MKVNEIDLKTIVPDLQKRCEKLQKASKIMMIAAFLIIPAVPAMIVMSKYGYCARLCRIVNYVKAQEKVPLTQVLGYAKNSVQAAQKLIDTGNLEGYRIVADAMLVKEGVEITEEDALKEAAAYYNLQRLSTWAWIQTTCPKWLRWRQNFNKLISKRLPRKTPRRTKPKRRQTKNSVPNAESRCPGKAKNSAPNAEPS